VTPLLVCLDLQRAFAEPGALCAPQAGEALLEGRRLLGYARQHRWPIAHALYVRSEEPMRVFGRQARPLDGFEPLVREMVFERETLSAYGHAAFAELMERTSSRAVLVIGLSASITLMATAFDAFERRQRLIIVADALASQQNFRADAQQHHNVALDVSRFLGFAIASADAARSAALRMSARLGVEYDDAQS
jgi:isochorismate hydrolase